VSFGFWLLSLFVGGVVLSLVASCLRWFFSKTGKGSVGGVWDGLQAVFDLLTGWPL